MTNCQHEDNYIYMSCINSNGSNYAVYNTEKQFQSLLASQQWCLTVEFTLTVISNWWVSLKSRVKVAIYYLNLCNLILELVSAYYKTYFKF